MSQPTALPSRSNRLDAIRTETSRAWTRPGAPETDCSTESLRAFGVAIEYGPARSLLDVASILEANGFAVSSVFEGTPKLSEFIGNHPTGSFILIAGRHAMALRDGALTDTDLRGTGRRRIDAAIRVES